MASTLEFDPVPQSARTLEFDEPIVAPVAQEEDRGVLDVAKEALINMLPGGQAIAAALDPERQAERLAGGVKTAANIGTTLLTPVMTEEQTTRNRELIQQVPQMMGLSPEGRGVAEGEFAAALAGTAGVPRALGALAGKAGLPAIAEALRTGGLTAAANYPTRVVAGALGAGASAGLINPEDASVAAGVGAAIPGVGLIAKGASDVAKMGSLDRTRRVLSDIIGGGDDLARARQLADEAAASGVPMTTAQALEQLKNPVLANLDESIRGTAATGKESVESARYYAAIAAQQEADRLAQLEQLTRAGNTEASEALRTEARRRLEVGLGPLREAELGAANTARDVTQRLAPRIASKDQSVVQMLQGQGRALTDEAQGAVVQQAGRPGWLDAGQFSQDMGDVADVMGRVKNLRQGERDFLQRQLDSLEAYGLRTLQPDAILGRIDTMLKSPKTGVSDVNQKVLGKVAEKVREWSQGGAIDAKALYEIRKTTINETVDDLLRGNPKASKQYAASLTAQIRPLIDDAIENAGGTDWKRYITSYRKGLEGIDRLELLDNARQLYKTNPKAFMDLVKGESPDTVRAIMSGKTGVEDALGSSTMKKLESVAGQLERDASLKNLAGTKGADRALKQILEDESFVAKLPNLLNRYAVLANTAAKAGELKINAQMYSRLEKAMRDPKAFKQLIDTLPLAERNKMINYVFAAAEQGGKALPTAAAVTPGVMNE